MTDLTAREVVEKLHQYDDLPSFPKINIHFLATAPGNEHLLKFMIYDIPQFVDAIVAQLI